MVSAFKTFCRKNNWELSKAKTLLAISGGVDSMVMAYLFAQAGFPFEVAHCNFKLRGKDSDSDEIFVKEMAAHWKVPYYSKSFDTKSIQGQRGGSIQMVARDLRYNWFEKLRQKEGFDFIATAHHRNDAIETLMLNLIRGTGLDGLGGIPVQTGSVIRPLLFAYKEDILEKAKDHSINFRKDRSNETTDYDRNYLRHAILPAFQRLNPLYQEHLFEASLRLKDTQSLLNQFMERYKDAERIREGDRTIFPFGPKEKAQPALVYYLLKPYGLEKGMLSKIIETSKTGAYFTTLSHRIWVDRGRLIIQPLRKEKAWKPRTIAYGEDRLKLENGTLELRYGTEHPPGFSPDKDQAFLDLDKLNFPLTIRCWRKGDFFYPLGQSGKKKVKKFFVDEKIPRWQKNRIWILQSRDSICWILGHRIDDRFKITAKTQRILQLKYNPNPINE